MKASRAAALLVLTALVVTATVYWFGLNGPFIFDDGYALAPVGDWYRGTINWREAVFGGSSLVFSRPVAMASFLLSTWLGGAESFSFKLGNLIVHLMCGLLVWRIGRHAFFLDQRLSRHGELLAALLTAFWLLHPLHVSTVLYAVQRMAQLSTFFTLAAVLVYLQGRSALARDSTWSAWARLFIAFPLMVVAGLLSKQNAAVAPLLCLALELAYFHDWRAHRRTVASFYGLFLIIPGAAACLLLVLHPQKVLGGYAEWDFTLGQRLLTQPRALMDYIGMLLFPRGPRMGLYTDDFAISSSLTSPPSTWLAIVGLIAISAGAIALRRRAPTLFAGWFFFLGAHAVESTFLPIEMYYEHRNYLPSVGLLMALVGIAALIPQTLQLNVLTRRQLGLIAATGFTLVLTFGTLGRVLMWQDLDSLLGQALRFHPTSMRANFDAADRAISRGDLATHAALMQRLLDGEDPRSRQMARFELVASHCRTGAGGNAALLEAAVVESRKLQRVTVFDTHAITRLSAASRVEKCGDLDRRAITGYLRQVVDGAAPQPESASPKWFARYLLSQMYGSTGQWPEASEQAGIAWKASGDKKIGVFLTRALANSSRLDEARHLLRIMEAQVPAHDVRGQSALTSLRELIAKRAAEAAAADLPGSA